MDTLIGRSPPYRLTEFFEHKGTALLLGEEIDPALFCDYNVGRALDKIYDTGTQKIFCQLNQNAIRNYGIPVDAVHGDTTSVNVFGDYDLVDPPFDITHGHSKDKRPDLKQFLIEPSALIAMSLFLAPHGMVTLQTKPLIVTSGFIPNQFHRFISHPFPAV